MKIVIVGGVAGGATAAARARRVSESCEIVLLERGPDISFSNCGLPYYIGGEIDDRDKLLVATPEGFSERYRVDVRVGAEVRSIDRGRKSVVILDRKTGRQIIETYDKLLLSPGARPVRPDVPGADLPGVRTLRDMSDVDAIRRRVDEGIETAIVVGGGYIGLEVAENLVKRKVKTTLVQSSDRILSSFDREMTTPIVEALRENGITLIFEDPAAGFAPGEIEGSPLVRLRSGRELSAGLVVLGVGVEPETTLATDAGIAVGEHGGIRVDAHMATDDPDIFAVGDAVEVEDYVMGGPTHVPLAGPANRQARVAADNMLGAGQPTYRGTQATAIVGVFSKTIAQTGATEKQLKDASRPYRKVYVHANNHAGYLKGAEKISLKVLFDPNGGRVLGAQAVGGEGVDKRIDALSLAIQAKVKVQELEEADLAYAPQFGAANDLINVAGSLGAGILSGEHPQVDADDLIASLESAGASELDEGCALVDVRSADEFSESHLPGAIHIPIDDLRRRLDEVPRDRPVVAYCASGQRGYLATRIMLQAGIDAANLGGGLKTYQLFRPDEG